MFSKTIFKQTLMSNYKLWAVFTAALCLLSGVVIMVFDPKMINDMMKMMKDTPFASMVGESFANAGSILGMLGESFYTMHGTILPMIYVIMTANALVASQVDRGSMAYILSTPIKRGTVVRTQALYLITAVFCSFAVLAVSGLAVAQIAHRALWGVKYTADVEAAAEKLDMDPSVLSTNLKLIAENPEAFAAGAGARGIGTDVYAVYLEQATQYNAVKAAADVLGQDPDTVSDDLQMILDHPQALQTAAAAISEETEAYAAALRVQIQYAAAMEAQMDEIQENLIEAMKAAADVMGKDVAKIDMQDIKNNEEALEAAAAAYGTDAAVFTASIVNQSLAMDEVSLDRGIEFDIGQYLLINFGGFLLMFAIAGISFLFSCVFNLSKNSLALGAGIPIAFFIFQIMAKASEDLKSFQYASINTLFDPGTIINGDGYIASFVAMAAIGTVLYAIGIKVFTRKDLPL